jgi:hypothetical protein
MAEKVIYTKETLIPLIHKVLKPFEKFRFYSQDAVILIAATIAHESLMGRYHKQLNNGVALGICQIEPNTEKDIWRNYLKYKPAIRLLIHKYYGVIDSRPYLLLDSDEYSILMCRIHYYRVKESIPDQANIEILAEYWKKHYNTVKGKGTIEEFIAHFNTFLL